MEFINLTNTFFVLRVRTLLLRLVTIIVIFVRGEEVRKRDSGFRSNEDEDKVIEKKTKKGQEARETTSVRLLFLKSFSFKYRFIALSLSHRKTTKHHHSDDDDDDESLRADGKDNETKKQKRSDADDNVHRRRVFRVPGAAECSRDHNGTFSRFGVRETK